MNYVMSDIHGNYEKYQGMLVQIQLHPSDNLFILGDVIDRGPKGIQILLDISNRQNVKLLLGNHEAIMYFALCSQQDDKSRSAFEGQKNLLQKWLTEDGGYPTYQDYLKLSPVQKHKILSYLENCEVFNELHIGVRNYLLSHAGIGDCVNKEAISLQPLSVFLEGSMDYQREYFPDKILVSGHTPTFLLEGAIVGKIYRKYNHIDLDCGVSFGKPLGCLCLETGKEYYE